MKLTSNSGREIVLNEEQWSDYLKVVTLHGEHVARSAAFTGILPSQITPEMLAERKLTRIARRQRQKQKRLDFRRYMNVVQALHAMVPEVHCHVENRIFHRARGLLPGMPQDRDDLRRPKPQAWQMLDENDKAVAKTYLFTLLKKLNENDWNKIRQLVPNECFQRMIEHANPSALAGML